MTAVAARDLAGLTVEQKRALLARLRGRAEARRPLSFGQERLWFAEQLDPGTPVYSQAFLDRLVGPLSAARFAAAVAAVVARHESLRARFDAEAGRPVQWVAPAVPTAVPVVDLAALPAERRRREADRLTTAEARRPFDLARAPLWRVALLRLAADEHLFLHVVHHIVFDVWSRSVFLAELAAVYDALAAGRRPALPPLALQYPDFADWQRRRLAGERLERDLAFWRGHLAGAPQVLELPTDAPRPPRQGWRGAKRQRVLDRAATDALVGLCREQGATPFLGFLAVYAVLLFRTSGRRDFLISTPVAGRGRVELESAIGFFVNNLVLRARVAPGAGFLDVLDGLRRSLPAALAHQELPFERLVEELAPVRTLAHAPLCQVAFDFLEGSHRPVAPSGLRAESQPLDKGTAMYDLLLVLVELAAGWEATLQYRTDLYRHATALATLERYERLLGAAVRDPRRPVERLELVSPDERRRAVERNDTAVAYPRRRTVDALVAEQAARRPSRVAVEGLGEALTYGELLARADAVAAALARAGVAPGEAVGVCLERSPELVVALLGVLRAGAAYVPLDPEYPPARRALMCEEAGLRRVVARRGAAAELPPGVEVVPVAAPPSPGWSPAAEACRPAAGLAYVLFTSGSTGRPKGVAVPHRAVLRLLFAGDDLAIGEDDVVAQAATPSFDAATYEIWGALAAGARLVLLPREVTLAPGDLAAALRRHRVTVLFLTTALFNQVARQEPGAFASLRCLSFGGEMVDAERVRQVLAAGPPGRLLHVYGPTETTTFATCHRVRAVAAGAPTVPIGRPIGNTTAWVLDRAGEPVPEGLPGELHLGGDGLADGYLGRPGATAEAFVPSPFGDRPGARLYRTGDLVRCDAAGDLEFLGRVDGQVKIRGFRIEPGEVEAALARHPRVSQAAVVVHGAGEERRLVGYAVARGATAGELRRHLQGELPDHLVPASVELLDAMPLTASGKIDRRALPAPADRAAAGDTPFVPPGDDIERAIAEVWQEVLQVERVGVHDNFFDLGGHSLLLARVHGRLKPRFARLDIVDLFDHPNVAALARFLARQAPAPADESERGAELSRGRDRLRRLQQALGGTPAAGAADALTEGA